MAACSIQTLADCAVTLAATLSGSHEAFVEGLNAFAKKHGCNGSYFTNVMGINDGVQKMTARDVATFSRYALQYTELRDMFEEEYLTVTAVKDGKTRSWPTSFEMKRKSAEGAYYSKADGGKTGSSNTEMGVMAFGGDHGYEYMAVVMGAPRKTENGELTNIAYADAKRLLRWGILNFRYETIARKNEPVARVPVDDCAERSDISLVPTKDLTTVLGEEIQSDQLTRRIVTTQERYTAPIEAGAVLGRMEVYCGDKLVASVPLVAATAAPRSGIYALWCDVKGWLFSGWFAALLIIAIVLVAGYIAYSIVYNRRKKSKK